MTIVAASILAFLLVFPSSASAAEPVARAAAKTGALDPAIAASLDDARYVYIASTRKSGELGKPAEIWFFRSGDDVCVGTRPSSWRVRRIEAGRPAARIEVGQPDGPGYAATGSIVDDDGLEARLMEAFAGKYGDDWKKWEAPFRDGFRDGSRVVVCYAPVPPAS